MTPRPAPAFRRTEIIIGRYVVEAQLTKDNPRWEVTVYENHVSRPVVNGHFYIEPTWARVKQRILAIAGVLAVDSLEED
jgi:hypothetical protein